MRITVVRPLLRQRIIAGYDDNRDRWFGADPWQWQNGSQKRDSGVKESVTRSIP